MSSRRDGGRTGVVCLHGFTGGAASWDGFRRAAPPDWRIECLELAGHGAAAAARPRDFDEEVDRLRAGSTLLAPSPQSVAAPRPVLVGYSLGARTALQLLRRHPHTVSAAVLIGVHPGLVSDAERRARRAADRRWIELLEDDGLEAFLAAWTRQPIFAGQERLGAKERAAQQAVRESHHAAGLAHSLRALGLAEMPESAATLRRPPVPVTLLVGGFDEKFLALARSVVNAADADSGARVSLEVVEGAGHNVLLERPQAVVEAVAGAARAARGVGVAG